MTSERLSTQLSASHDFLFAKTDASCFGRPPVFQDMAFPPKPIADIFPDMASGDAFRGQALLVMSAAQTFCVLAVRVLNPDMAALLQTAKVLDLSCREEEGVWGMTAPGLFACFFSEKTDSFCDRISAHIQSRLPRNTHRPELIIGTAVYPTLSYGRDQILENAEKALDHAAFFGPGSAVAFDDVTLNISGDGFFQKNQIEAAVGEYRNALALNNENINVHNSLGVCYGLLGCLDMAQKEFEAAIACDDLEAMALYNLGLIYMLRDHREKALDFFQRALAVKDDIFEVVLQTGRLLLELGNPKESLPLLKQAFRLKASSASAARLLGDCFVALRDMNDAMEAYKKAIKLNPNDAASLSTLGALYDLKGENPEIATLYCEKSVQLSPEEGLYYMRLGKIYQKQNRMEEAQQAFAAAAQFGKKHRESFEPVEHSRES